VFARSERYLHLKTTFASTHRAALGKCSDLEQLGLPAFADFYGMFWGHAKVTWKCPKLARATIIADDAFLAAHLSCVFARKDALAAEFVGAGVRRALIRKITTISAKSRRV
jgi:hypothetical protein